MPWVLSKLDRNIRKKPRINALFSQKRDADALAGLSPYSKGGPSHAWVHHVDPKPHPQACWLHVTFRKGLFLVAVAGLQVIP